MKLIELLKMKYFVRIASLALVLCIYFQGVAQTFNWAVPVEDKAYDRLNDASSVTTDAERNVYIVGSFLDIMDFDPGPGTAILNHIISSPIARNVESVYLAKYDADGKYLWAKVVKSVILRDNLGVNIADGHSMGVVADVNGNISVIGNYRGKAYFNIGKGIDSFYAYNGAYGGGGWGVNNLFLARFDSDGNYTWMKEVRAIGNSSNPEFDDINKNTLPNGKIAVDGTGSMYISGCLWGDPFDFDPGPGIASLIRTSLYNYFIAKYDSNGNYVWVQGIGLRGDIKSPRLAVDTVGNRNSVYMTGFFKDTINFGGTSLTSVMGGWEIFIAKYDSSGRFIWAKAIGGTGMDEGRDISVDRSGDICVTGYFMNTVDFDPGPDIFTLTANGIIDAFVAKYDKDGNYIWAKNIGGIGAMGMAEYINTDVFRNIYISGTIGFGGSNIDFDPGPNTAMIKVNGMADTYVGKYDACGNYIWAGGMHGKDVNSIAQPYGMSVNPVVGEVVVTGTFSGGVDANPGSDTTWLTVSEGYSSFIAKLTFSDTPGRPTYITVSTCEESYTLNETTYTSSGVYMQLLPGITRCDSIVILDLTLNAPIDEPVINVNGFELGVAGTYATYQWIKNGTPIPGATNSAYRVTENGAYQVAVTNEVGCADTSAVYTITNVSVHDAIQLKNQIRIYPNPASNIVYIKAPFTVHIRITDVTGKLVKEKWNAIDISVDELAKGIYLLSVRDEEGGVIKVEKLVKAE